MDTGNTGSSLEMKENTGKKRKHKKETTRGRTKYPALNPRFMPKVRQEYMDIDYLDKLSDEELKWLNKVIDEELNASFKNNSKDITKDPEKKREIYNKNNARNRCLYGIARATGHLEYKDIFSEDNDVVNNPGLYEDAIIEQIDSKKRKENEP